MKWVGLSVDVGQIISRSDCSAAECCIEALPLTYARSQRLVGNAYMNLWFKLVYHGYPGGTRGSSRHYELEVRNEKRELKNFMGK